MNPTDKVLMFDEAVEPVEQPRKRWLDRLRGTAPGRSPRPASRVAETSSEQAAPRAVTPSPAEYEASASSNGVTPHQATAVLEPLPEADAVPVVALDSDNLDGTLEQLRARALHLARVDAEQGLPEAGATSLPTLRSNSPNSAGPSLVDGELGAGKRWRISPLIWSAPFPTRSTTPACSWTA